MSIVSENPRWGVRSFIRRRRRKAEELFEAVMPRSRISVASGTPT